MRRTRTLLATTSALVVALAAQAHAAPPAANDRSIPFGDGTAWLAVRGRTPQQIAAALKLSNLRPATWKDGLAAANAGGSRAVFLTPDVHGWTLVVSAGFLSRVEAVPPDFHAFTNALSARLKTEVQFFAYEDRTEETLCAWARAIGEATVRAFSCFRTRARAVDVGVPDVDDMDVAIVRGEYVGTPDVTGIAGHWSIDPSTIHPGAPADRRIPTAVPRGYLAELPKDQPRKVAAPRFAPPDWVREAGREDRPARGGARRLLHAR